MAKKKTKKAKGILIGGAFSEWYARRKDGKLHKIHVKRDELPPLGAIEKWRDAKTGYFTKVPPEAVQIESVVKTHKLRYLVEGKRGWKSPENVNFGREKVRVGLFDESNNLERLITQDFQLLPNWKRTLFGLEEYQTLPEGRAVTIAMHGDTIRDCLEELHIGGLGWGAELHFDIKLKYFSEGTKTLQKLHLVHRQNFISLPLGETYDSKCKNDLGRTIRNALKNRNMRFTTLEEMESRLYSKKFWRDGMKPDNSIIDAILEDWEKCEQVSRLEMTIAIVRVALPRESDIKKGHLRFANQRIFYTCTDPKSKTVKVFRTKQKRDSFAVEVRRQTYKKGARVFHYLPGLSSFFGFDWKDYTMPEILKSNAYKIRKGF